MMPCYLVFWFVYIVDVLDQFLINLGGYIKFLLMELFLYLYEDFVNFVNLLRKIFFQDLYVFIETVQYPIFNSLCLF